jgi:hypothetical protein
MSIIKKTIAIFLWGGLSLAAMGMVAHYQFQPNRADAAVPKTWPADSHLARDSSRLTLLMFLHPQCPCSTASLAELTMLMSRASDRIATKTIFVAPASVPEGWTDSSLWQQANSIPGTAATIDAGGHEASAFHITTSGEVRLYDPAGHLIFQGGITSSRGHEGDNAGVDSILALARGQSSQVIRTPVFGCAVRDSK